MNKKKIALLSVASVALIARVKWWTYINDLEDRFPQTPRWVLSKAFRRYLMDAACGRLPINDNTPDEEMDELFVPYCVDILMNQ